MGLWLDASNNTISGNIFSDDGLYVSYSYGNVVVDNLMNGKPLVYLEKVSNYVVEEAGQVILINCTGIRVENLNLSKTSVGVELWGTRNCTVSGNNITNNRYGVILRFSSNDTISRNNITANRGYGISLYSSNNTMVIKNNIRNNYQGISLSLSPNSTLRNNIISGNNYSLEVFGLVLSDYATLSIDVSNIVNGKPVHYLLNQKDLLINPLTYPEIGYLALVNSTNITVENLTLTKNGQGLLLAYTNNSKIRNNNVTNNKVGVYLHLCSNTTLNGNKIMANREGIYLHDSSNNSIVGNNIVNNNYGVELYSSYVCFVYHNNFVDNNRQVYSHNSTSFWDDGYPSGGNYWSDYNGTDLYSGPYQNDTGYDWIGDTPYMIDENDQDNYPLMYPFVPEMEEIRIAYRNLLLKYTELYSDFEALNSTLNKFLDNITDLQEKYNSLLTTTNDMQERIDSLNSTFQMSIDDLQERVNLLNSTLQTSINELQELYNSLNYTLTSKQEAIMYEISTLRNIMYVFIATTIILIATTVYFAKRKPRTKPEKQ